MVPGDLVLLQGIGLPDTHYRVLGATELSG